MTQRHHIQLVVQSCAMSHSFFALRAFTHILSPLFLFRLFPSFLSFSFRVFSPGCRVAVSRELGLQSAPSTPPDVSVPWADLGRHREANLLVHNLTKRYRKGLCQGQTTVVDQLSLSIKPNEGFALLGENGQGKSTTFRMLTGDEAPSVGSVYVNGADLARQPWRAWHNLGYCPQDDALIEHMTGRELLTMVAELRGFRPHAHRAIIQSLIEDLDLQRYADSPCGLYSGGNKRKLSTAMALVGDPKVILLDECATGMDPKSRQAVWRVLRSTIENTDRSFVLTSHTMDECEALCTRLAIIKGGRLQCLGSPQYLKSRFAGGCRIVSLFQITK